MATVQYEPGPAETEARRLTRDSELCSVATVEAIRMLARLLDDARHDLAEHMQTCPHQEVRVPLQMTERLAERAADNARVNVR